MSETFFFPTEGGASSTAPQVDDGLALGRFDDLKEIEHPDWAGTDNYGNEDTGVRRHFQFTLVDDNHDPIYGDDGDPIVIEKLTRTAMGKRSKYREVMQGILTPAEFTAFIAALDNKTPFSAPQVQGRVYNIKVSHSGSGWPQVEDVIGIAKAKK